jgi:hypothetical protein
MAGHGTGSVSMTGVVGGSKILISTTDLDRIIYASLFHFISVDKLLHTIGPSRVVATTQAYVPHVVATCKSRATIVRACTVERQQNGSPSTRDN